MPLVVGNADQWPLNKGNPVYTHRKVAGIQPTMFGSWLDLFEATSAELLVPEVANRFASAARRIGESLKLAIFFRPNHSWPDDLRHRPPVVHKCV
jgi:hemoglobin